MVEPKKTTCFEYDTVYEGEHKILRVNLEGCTFLPAIEDSSICMGKVIDALLEVAGVGVLILSQRRKYEYSADQVAILYELANLIKKLTKEEREIHSQLVTDPAFENYLRASYAIFQKLISKTLKEDPLAAYVELRRMHRRETIKRDNSLNDMQRQAQGKLLVQVEQVLAQLDGLQLIKMLMPHIHDYRAGERVLYKNIFQPSTKPDFIYTKLISEYPEGNLLDSYSFGTDGYGRSDSRKKLRRFFEVDKEHIVTYALSALAKDQLISSKYAEKAMKKYKIDKNKPIPTEL